MKKFYKIAALVLALALMAGIGLFANSLVGNPVSKLLAQRTAEAYLAQTYGGTDFYVEDLGFSFKDGHYYAHIKSPSSMDTWFTLYITMGGRLTQDTYPDVLSGSTTARRLMDGYRALADTVLESPAFPYESEIAFGDLEIIDRAWLGGEDVPDYALIEDQLELDKLYDIPALGAKAGHLVIYVSDETVTVERAAEIMLDIKSLMDDGGVPFYVMDFTLQHPRPTPDAPRPEGSIRILNFPYADIYKEDMINRVQTAYRDTMAYYAERDGEK